MSEARNDHVIELIPAYALNTLEPAEAEAVARHLDGCPTCQAELTSYQAVVDVLPLTAPEAEPSPALKRELMDRLAPAVRDTGPAELESESWWQRTAGGLRRWLSGPRWQPVVLTFILALLAVNVVLLLQRDDRPENPWTAPIVLSGTEATPDAVGVIYVSADGRHGTLVVDGLSSLNQESQYQLWLILDGERTSGGVFSVNEAGYRGIEINAPLPLNDYASFGITVEPAGGSLAPTGERVLGYNL